MKAAVWLHPAGHPLDYPPRRVEIDFGPTAAVPHEFTYDGTRWEKLIGRGSPEEPHFEEIRS